MSRGTATVADGAVVVPARRRAQLRLVPVAGAVWAAALISTLLPAAAAPVALALWGACLAALCGLLAAARREHRTPRVRRRRMRAAVVLALLLAASAAVGSHVALAQPARAEVERFALGGGRAVVFDATVAGKVETRASGEWEFDAVATHVSTGAVADAVRIDVTVRVQPSRVDRAPLLDVGSAVEVSGTARPGASGARAVLAVNASRGVRVLSAPQGVLAVAGELRRGLVRAAGGLPAPGAELIPGLAVGDTSAVSAELDAAMKRSSLSHLTAVSGSNCAIVVGLAFGAVAAVGGSRRARVTVASAALFGFVLLVTAEPSVVRAAAMAGIAMLGVLLGRTGMGMGVLSLAVTVLLVGDPWLSGSLGFALSTVATASLLLFARPLAAGLERWMPRPLALALSVPLAAQLACGPLLLGVTPSVPLYGVLANLLAAPAAPIATVLGLTACVAAPLPWLQSGLTALAWLPASWIAGAATTFSALPGDQIPWLSGWPGVLCLAVVGSAVAIAIALPPTGSTRQRRVRLVAVFLLAAVTGVSAGGAALSSVAGRWTLPSSWSILACDVGQGDAVLLRSGQAVALVDAGPEPARLEACLARAGVQRIDLLLLTHFDLDHVGGVAAVADRVGTALHGPAGSPEASAVLSLLEGGGARMVSARAGLTGSLGDARWRVLWPPPRSRAFEAGNDASVVLDVRGGGMPAALFLGDLSASPQRALAASAVLDPPYDLVKVAHHGSADQDPDLYAGAQPALALITVGENRYGHPRAEVLDALSLLGARIARTDRAGAIAVWRDGEALRVWRERGSDVGPAG
ncbi:ComEC/Rec2 family competence protein [Microbacterium sp. zg.B48]|uniref:ComEC/Rec2 family competence protein n=1 Tax=Microbacterium sp. zg.B48 TaxID=2969408 RepID=UPI00214ADB5F|nr:ComEC/Rec2 family competence protein [Microbacterium sp. zg.B48]MCR2765160.1 ComEC/Rec2 family competence protein [Microbacterium sp. zg.B48]